MTAPARAPQGFERSGPLRNAAPYLVLYAVLAAVPALLWATAGNPVTATSPYLNLNQAELLWNTLLASPADDKPALLQAVVDLVWLLWAPFALAAALQLLVAVLGLPRTVIPRILLRLTPTTVVSLVVTGTAATVAHAHTGAVHARTLDHYGHRPHGGGPRGCSTLEAEIADAITFRDQPMHVAAIDERVVRPGDTLWTIAQDDYRHGRDWAEIYAANHGRTQPDGTALTDPDVIKPGWILAIPAPNGDAATPPRVARTGPEPPVTAVAPDTPTTAATPAPAPTARITPQNRDTGATARDSAAPGVTARPTNAAPHRHADVPPRPAQRPRPAVPWTTGIDLPGGGYIGVTLLMGIAATLVALRCRAHRTGRTTPIPETAEQLAITTARAEMAEAGTWDPELETDPTPPPLLRLRPEHLIFGTAADGTNEAVLDPQHHPLTVYTGPGAHQAAAALALSALSSATPHRLIITEPLAHQLLGPDVRSPDPAWLKLTPDTATALKTAAAGADASTDADSPELRTLVIADAPSAGIFPISAALAADKQRNRLAILLLGDPAHLAAHPLTRIDIDDDGRPNKTTGPRAAAFAGARFHTLPPASAADLYNVLRYDRTATAIRIPAQARDEHQPRPLDQQPDPDPTDDEDHDHPATDVAAPDDSQPVNSPEPPRIHRASAPTHDDVSAASAAAKGPGDAAPDQLLLRIFGPLTLENTDGHTKPGPTGRGAQLLTYLALHPRGRTLRQITADIWHAENPAGANRALVRLRQDLASAITELAPDLAAYAGPGLQPVVRGPHGTYHLNHDLIRTDQADFARLATEADREEDPARRTELAAQALAHVRGELAEGVSDADQEWLTWSREDLRTQARGLTSATDAVCTDPELRGAALGHL